MTAQEVSILAMADTPQAKAPLSPVTHVVQKETLMLLKTALIAGQLYDELINAVKAGRVFGDDNQSGVARGETAHGSLHHKTAFVAPRRAMIEIHDSPPRRRASPIEYCDHVAER